MTLREFPGALILGVLAALLAHTVLYGGDHAMGGPYHAALLQLAVLGSVGLLAFYVSLIWLGSRHAADGSVLATRIASRLPSPIPLLASGVLWYSLAEHIEPEHAMHAPLVAIVLALIAASWLVLALVRGFTRLLAAAVLAIARPRWADRIVFWVERHPARRIARRTFFQRRLFARPPPVAIVLCA